MNCLLSLYMNHFAFVCVLTLDMNCFFSLYLNIGFELCNSSVSCFSFVYEVLFLLLITHRLLLQALTVIIEEAEKNKKKT